MSIRTQLEQSDRTGGQRFRQSRREDVYIDCDYNRAPLRQHGSTEVSDTSKADLIVKVSSINAMRRRRNPLGPTEEKKMAIMICPKCDKAIDLDTNLEDWNQIEECCVDC